MTFCHVVWAGLLYKCQKQLLHNRINLSNNSLCIAVNEESEDDEGYGSIAGYDPNKYRKFPVQNDLFPIVYVLWNFLSASKTKMRRKKIREEDLKIVEGDSKEILIEKFLSLKDSYDILKDENTLLEYENESLKDDQDEKEEEVNTKHF